MPNSTYNNKLTLPFLIVIFITAAAASLFILKTPPMISIGIIITIAIFTISFLNTRVSLSILIISMLLSPEIMMSSMGEKNLAGRGVTLRTEDFLLIVIGISWLMKTAVYKELGLFLKTPLNKPIAFYTLICFLTTVVGVISGRVVLKTGFFFVLKYIEYYVIYFMVVNNLKSKDDIKKFMFIIFITCAIVSFIGIIQIPSGDRVTAPFEGKDSEPNTLGGYLVLILSFAIALILNIKTREKYFLSILCILTAPPLLFTLSRSSWLSSVPMLISLFLLSNKRLSLAGVFIIVAITGYLFMPKEVVNRFLYTFQEEKFSHTEKIGKVAFDPSTSARIERYKISIKRFKEYPLLGRGVTGAGFIDGQYNRVLEEAGILGIIGFFWIIIAIYKNAFLLFKTTEDSYFKGLSLGLIAAMSAMLVHAIGGNSFIIVRIMEPFWFLVGIVTVASIISASDKNVVRG